MKNLKMLVFALCATVGAVMSVNAATICTDNSNPSCWVNRSWEAEVSGTDAITVKLTNDSNAGLEVNANETVILDLNGHKLTNWCDGTNCGENAYASAIDVRTGGHLTIIDTSNSKAGKVELATGTKNVSTVVNNGTLEIQGGTFSILSTAGNGLSVVSNNGEMTVSGGTFTSNTTNAAAIHNAGTISITGGTISTGVAQSWGLTNNGTATISGGEFIQNHDFSVIQNAGTMTISDGEFKTNGEEGHNSLITNQNSTTGKATLEVEGGDFDAELLFYNDEEDTLDITGGNFSETSNIDTYLENSNYEADENGNVVLKDVDYTALDKVIAEAEKVDKTKYTEESIKALEEALTAAKAISRTLKADEQSSIDVATTTLNDAIKALTEIEEEQESKEETPNTIDNAIMYIALASASILVASGLVVYYKRFN